MMMLRGYTVTGLICAVALFSSAYSSVAPKPNGNLLATVKLSARERLDPRVYARLESDQTEQYERLEDKQATQRRILKSKQAVELREVLLKELSSIPKEFQDQYVELAKNLTPVEAKIRINKNLGNSTKGLESQRNAILTKIRTLALDKSRQQTELVKELAEIDTEIRGHRIARFDFFDYGNPEARNAAMSEAMGLVRERIVALLPPVLLTRETMLKVIEQNLPVQVTPDLGRFTKEWGKTDPNLKSLHKVTPIPLGQFGKVMNKTLRSLRKLALVSFDHAPHRVYLPITTLIDPSPPAMDALLRIQQWQIPPPTGPEGVAAEKKSAKRESNSDRLKEKQHFARELMDGEQRCWRIQSLTDYMERLRNAMKDNAKPTPEPTPPKETPASRQEPVFSTKLETYGYGQCVHCSNLTTASYTYIDADFLPNRPQPKNGYYCLEHYPLSRYLAKGGAAKAEQPELEEKVALLEEIRLAEQRTSAVGVRINKTLSVQEDRKETSKKSEKVQNDALTEVMRRLKDSTWMFD